MNRRNFLMTTGLLVLPLTYVFADKNELNSKCLTDLEGIDVESDDAVGYEHYHQLILPVSALVNPPTSGIWLRTSAVDQGSYDELGMQDFSKSINVNVEAMRSHTHDVFISYEELKSIAAGAKKVEVKAYARDKKTYVHNFFITAPPSALAVVKRERS